MLKDLNNPRSTVNPLSATDEFRPILTAKQSRFLVVSVIYYDNRPHVSWWATALTTPVTTPHHEKHEIIHPAV